MVVNIVTAGVVADPMIALDLDVRRVRMARLLVIATVRRRGMRRAFICARTVGGNVAAADLGVALFLRESWKRENQECSSESNQFLHVSLFLCCRHNASGPGCVGLVLRR